VSLLRLLLSVCPLLAADVPAAVADQLPETLSEEELSAGWIKLFDGRSLYGWQAEKQDTWKVADGAITAGGTAGLLRTTTMFGNVEFSFEAQASADAEAAFWLRSAASPANSGDGYRLIVSAGDTSSDGSNRHGVGSLDGRRACDLQPQAGQWRRFRVSMIRSRIEVFVDGKSQYVHVDRQPLGRGHFALQLSAGELAVRDVKLRPLAAIPMFNGRNLAGWRVRPGMDSKFTVTPEGALRVRGGPGQIETLRKYGDFLLQLQAITHAAGLNSGVFFRCIPGEKMMGYECQIDNGFQGDRTQPTDCGTGGIFRRQDARLIVADDRRWFHLTLVADGPHMAAWVDGIQVSDWTDTRRPHANPRKGRRLEPGTIILQGHDPTTNLSFRDMSISRLPER